MAKAAGGEQLDFENLSDTQLREMIEYARETLRERITNRLEEFRALAQEAGFAVTIEKIGEGDGRRRRRSSGETGTGPDRRREIPPKYRNPDNQSETWSGRGHRPRWVLRELEQGRAMADLLITPAAPQGAQPAAA